MTAIAFVVLLNRRIFLAGFVSHSMACSGLSNRRNQCFDFATKLEPFRNFKLQFIGSMLAYVRTSIKKLRQGLIAEVSSKVFRRENGLDR